MVVQVKRAISENSLSKLGREDLTRVREIYDRYNWRSDQEQNLSDAGFIIFIHLGAQIDGEDTDERLWGNRTGELIIWDNYIGCEAYIFQKMQINQISAKLYQIYDLAEKLRKSFENELDQMEDLVRQLDYEFLDQEKSIDDHIIRCYSNKKPPQEELIIFKPSDFQVEFFKRIDLIEL